MDKISKKSENKINKELLTQVVTQILVGISTFFIPIIVAKIIDHLFPDEPDSGAPDGSYNEHH